MAIPLRLCTHAGCSELVPFNQRYCAKHKPDLKRQATRQERMEYEAKELQFYASARWRKLSKSFRLRFPVCKSCLERGIVREAGLVDHIWSIKTPRGWEHRLSESNLQSLCIPCHNAKTAREIAERRGQSPDE
ncbi:HNH endonuclease [Schleiferilactobacillus perolens]|jgi:5-methylcytosine-specific restriction endonuclease McrA|uniref:HNH endonuclease n=1 Tax=Schleiferilactobacillus perolens TaxID=100468 RepID=UPI0023568AA1|nr:HNH endonuclease [Schleiferilactobacillus perolens]MCI2170982.1 HNH endonuclease [Schleiferilactobacillus perolens]